MLQAVDDKRAGVSSSTVRRRLSSVSGLYAFLHARGTDAPESGHNTETLVVQCADDTVTVRIIKPDSGAFGWEVDVQRELTGVRFFVTSIDARFYLGALTAEPVGVDPLFATTTEWGNRTGHEGTVLCSASETFTEEGQVLTGFFDVTRYTAGQGQLTVGIGEPVTLCRRAVL